MVLPIAAANRALMADLRLRAIIQDLPQLVLILALRPGVLMAALARLDMARLALGHPALGMRALLAAA